jgi:hypothetical protein
MLFLMVLFMGCVPSTPKLHFRYRRGVRRKLIPSDANAFDEVITIIENALSRSMSPAQIAKYKLHLHDKKIVERKLRELAELAEDIPDEDSLTDENKTLALIKIHH